VPDPVNKVMTIIMLTLGQSCWLVNKNGIDPALGLLSRNKSCDTIFQYHTTMFCFYAKPIQDNVLFDISVFCTDKCFPFLEHTKFQVCCRHSHLVS